MAANSISPETAPWRELVETLHEQNAWLRDQLEVAHARAGFLQSLLEADRNLDRESRLLALLEQDRAELQRLRDSRPLPPSAVATSRGPSALHAQILAALAAHPAGLTCAQVEAAVGTGLLGNVLDGLARRKHIKRLGKGVFALGDDASRPAEGAQRP